MFRCLLAAELVGKVVHLGLGCSLVGLISLESRYVFTWSLREEEDRVGYARTIGFESV